MYLDFIETREHRDELMPEEGQSRADRLRRAAERYGVDVGLALGTFDQLRFNGMTCSWVQGSAD